MVLAKKKVKLVKGTMKGIKMKEEPKVEVKNGNFEEAAEINQ